MKDKNIHEEIIKAIGEAILKEGKAVIGPTDIKKLINIKNSGRKLHYETAKKVLKEFILSYKLIKKIEEEGYILSPKYVKDVPFITIMPKDIFHELLLEEEIKFYPISNDESTYIPTFKYTPPPVSDEEFKVEHEV